MSIKLQNSNILGQKNRNFRESLKQTKEINEVKSS